MRRTGIYLPVMPAVLLIAVLSGWTPLETLNTPFHEFSPAISPDGSFLVFSSDRPGGLGDQDLWISYRSNGVWTAPRNLTALNSPFHDHEPFVSYDGRMILFSSDRDGGYGAGDLYLSYRTTDGWSSPVNLGPAINTRDSEKMPSLSMDGRTLYFSRAPVDPVARRVMSERIRIWTARNLDGRWSPPQPLPEPVNVDAWDCAGRIMPDDRTLVFASKREGGRGGFDLWKAVRSSPDAPWSSVSNLAEVNTEGNESHFAISVDGQRIVLAAAWNPDNGFDLFGRTLTRPASSPTVTLQGRLYDAESGAALSGHLGLDSFTGRNPSFQVLTGPDGRYSVTLPAGDMWSLTAEAPEYAFRSERLDLSRLAASAVTNIDIPLVPLKRGRTIRLETVYFDPDSATLRPESAIVLDRLADLLRSHPELRILIKGHVAAVGERTEETMRLSQARAEAVRAYLVGRGIAADRLEAQGYGDTMPVADNTTEEGRRLNRRTEFEILEDRRRP